MSYVIYHKETTHILGKKEGYKTEKGAKIVRSQYAAKPEEFAIADKAHFHSHIEKKEIRKGIVGSEGKEFEVGVNTPWTSGPWSETYWCS